jgi:hypothetical protein
MRSRSATTLALVCLLLQAGAAAGAEEAWPLDMAKAVNMAFQDDVAGDGVGGWTDQGGNDFQHMPLVEQTLCGVPFRIVDPAKNAGKGCPVLRGHGRKDLPDSAKVPVGRKGGILLNTTSVKDPRGIRVLAAAIPRRGATLREQGGDAAVFKEAR